MNLIRKIILLLPFFIFALGQAPQAQATSVFYTIEIYQQQKTANEQKVLRLKNKLRKTKTRYSKQLKRLKRQLGNTKLRDIDRLERLAGKIAKIKIQRLRKVQRLKRKIRRAKKGNKKPFIIF